MTPFIEGMITGASFMGASVIVGALLTWIVQTVVRKWE